MSKKMTLKQRKFLKNYLETGSATKAVESSYNLGSKGGSKTPEQKYNVAKAMGSENLAKLAQSGTIQQELEKLGITTDTVAKKIKSLLNCGDKRVEKDMLDMWMKITSGYAPDKTWLLSRSDIIIKSGKDSELESLADQVNETNKENTKTK